VTRPEYPVLVVVGGLPGTGKSTIATLVARRMRAPYLRVDRIEHALAVSCDPPRPVGVAGYAVAHALAAEQVVLGLDVVVECVNPLPVTRDGWVRTARAAAASIVQVEVICSDPVEHRRRVETRTSDVDGLVKPTWEEVLGREYLPWDRPHLTVDTAGLSAHEAADCIAAATAEARQRPLAG
jgi:predicted kinase